MIGAIAGDIIGSRFEFNNIDTKDFDLFVEQSFFTDDTVLTCAIADAVLGSRDYAAALKWYGRKYFGRGYGDRFERWLASDSMEPYGSCGNGSAMRVSPVAYAFNNLETVLAEAERSAAATHDHPEGIKGAQATAAAIFLARKGKSKEDIRKFVSEQFGYGLERTMEWLYENYRYNETCQGTVPEAIICFLESTSFEDAIRNAISIGGDSDTLACITGSIAEAFYADIPPSMRDEVYRRLPVELADLILKFGEKFWGSSPSYKRMTAVLKYKCLDCGLHFALYTYRQEQWASRLPTCPECANATGKTHFLTWITTDEQPIYMHIPGKSGRLGYSPKIPNEGESIIIDRQRNKQAAA